MSFKGLPYDQHLRNKWRSIQRAPCAKSWRDYDAFCRWATAHGYGDDRWLKRIDPSKPWGPHNCKIIQASTITKDDGFAARWDATVADFRQRLEWAGTNDPAAIDRLLSSGLMAAKKSAPGSTSPESGAREISTC